MSNLLQEIEQALDSPVPPGEATTAVEAIAAESAPEEIAAAGVGITATEFFPVVIILGMLAAAATWLRPIFKAQTHQHHSLLFRIVTWPARKVEQGITDIEHRVEHAMGHWLAPKAKLLAHWLNSTTHILHALTATVAELADNTHEALVFLRHHVVPQMIVKALAPVVREIERLATALERARTAVATELARIGRTVGGTFASAVSVLAAVVVELWNEVYKTLKPQVQLLGREVTTLKAQLTALTLYVKTFVETQVESVQAQVETLAQRVTAVEKALAPAAMLALITAALGTAWQNLTCRNTQTAASQLCLMDEALLTDVLALLAGAFILSDLRTYVRVMQEITHDTTTLVHELLSV